MFTYWFDIAAFVFLVSLVIFSAIRGFFREIVVIAAWAGGYLGSIVLHPVLSPVFGTLFKTGALVDLATFFTSFVALYALIRVGGWFAVKKLSLKEVTGPFNSSAGAVLGGVKWLFLMAVFMSPLNLFPQLKTSLMEKSVTASAIMKLSWKMTTLTEADIKDAGRKVEKKIKRAAGTAKNEMEKKSADLRDLIKNGAEKSGENIEEKADELTEKDREQMNTLLKSLE